MEAASYLDSVEAKNRFVLLEADNSTTPWTTSALRRADRTLIVVSPDPSEAEERLATAFSVAARAAHRPEVWLAVVRTADDPAPSNTSALIKAYGADRAIHVRKGSKADMDRLARLLTGTGVGLVLGGGGARGFAHLGVYQAIVEQGIPVDAVSGASIGGILGAAIATGAPPHEVIAMAKSGFSDVLDYTVPLVSLVQGHKITKAIDGVFKGMDIEDLPIPFLCVSTDLTSSQLIVHDRGPVTKWTRAGLAIPGVIPPVPHEGHLLVDGGVLDNLPIGPLRDSGLVGTVLAVDLAAPAGPKARSDFGLGVSGWKALRGSVGRKKRKLPGISAVLMRTMTVASMRKRDQQLAAGLADLVLRPKLHGVSLLDFSQVERVAKAGYESAKPKIAEWLAAAESEGMNDASPDAS